MIAALPMYDWPEVAWATDALWANIRDRLRDGGIAAPDALTRPDDLLRAWRAPDLLLAQTCGYPYASALRGSVRLVATPSYAAEGCEGPTYRSAIVARRSAGDGERGGALGALRGCRAAFNSGDSLSGLVGFRAALAEAGFDPAAFFSAWHETGGHRGSILAVAAGVADCAAIDCVSWALAQAHLPDVVARLRVVGWTPRAPALPFVTAGSRSDDEIDALRQGLRAALEDPTLAEASSALLLRDVEVLPDTVYDRALELAVAGGLATAAAPGARAT